MAIHLITVVGGQVDVLAHMLSYYRSLGIESFFVNLHLSDENDPTRERVEMIARQDGCGIASTTVGEWQLVQQELYLRQRERYPSDWFVLADQDEFQIWPEHVGDILKDNAAWDYVGGCFIDRLTRDGCFPKVDCRPIWDQFPLGCVLSARILGATPNKVVAVKGPVPLMKGQHYSHSGRAWPSRELYIPVHHFKWTRGVVARLARRAAELKKQGFPHWTESARFVEYLRLNGGQINLLDKDLLVAECSPAYPYWELVKRLALGSEGL